MVANHNAMRSTGIAAVMAISFAIAAGCAPKEQASAPSPQSSVVAPAITQASPTSTMPPANGAMTEAQVQESDSASAKLKLTP